MINNENNIDNFLKNRFDDFSAPPAENVRAKVSSKVARFNFFRFSIASFNVFYLAALIIGVSTTLAFFSGVFDSGKSETINIEQTSNQNNEVENTNSTEENASIKQTQDIHSENPLNETSQIENIITEEKTVLANIPQTEISTNNVELNETISESEIVTEIQDTNEFSNNTVTEDRNADIDVSINSQIDEGLPILIIYDTIYTTNKITIVDTVTTEIRKEVKVRKPRKNRR